MSGLAPDLVSNLQNVLLSRKVDGDNDGGSNKQNGDLPTDSAESPKSPVKEKTESERVHDSRPIVLLTNGQGIESGGLIHLVEGLVKEGLYIVHVCAPQLDKSASGHSVTTGETIAATSTELTGAVAYEVSGTPVDCVSLALSGALFSWSKPTLVISGINLGSTCGHQMHYSGCLAASREALIHGVPALSISLNRNKENSQEKDITDGVSVCLPLIKAAIKGIEEGCFPSSCFLSVELPTSPATNKGYKLTKQSMCSSSLHWSAVSVNRYPAGHFLANQQGFGMQLAQLGRDASAAGAARRLVTQKKNLEVVESVGAAGKSEFNRVKKYFRAEFLAKEQEQEEEDLDLDFRAMESGYVAVTPVSPFGHVEPQVQSAVSDWIATFSAN